MSFAVQHDQSHSHCQHLTLSFHSDLLFRCVSLTSQFQGWLKPCIDNIILYFDIVTFNTALQLFHQTYSIILYLMDFV